MNKRSKCYAGKKSSIFKPKKSLLLGKEKN